MLSIFPGSFVTLLDGFIPYEVTKVMDGRVWVVGGNCWYTLEEVKRYIP